MPGLLGGEKPRSISTLPGKRQANGNTRAGRARRCKMGTCSRLSRLDRRDGSRTDAQERRAWPSHGLKQAAQRKSGSEQVRIR